MRWLSRCEISRAVGKSARALSTARAITSARPAPVEVRMVAGPRALSSVIVYGPEARTAFPQRTS